MVSKWLRLELKMWLILRIYVFKLERQKGLSAPEK